MMRRNKKNQQYKQGMALFVIFLIISMSVSSASVMAESVQITKNTGQAGMDGALDASSDVWTVEALISDFDGVGGENNSIDPNDVKIVINKNSESFQSCSSSTLGVVCQYVSALTGGVKEGAYNFVVRYEMYKDVDMANKNPGASALVVADGSGPDVNFVSAIQNGQYLLLNFIVSDITNNRPSVGLKNVDIFDAETGKLIDTVSNFTKEDYVFDYTKERGNEGKLLLPWKDEGIKTIKVLAYDRLGHVSDAAFKKLEIDNVKPVIKDETLQFPMLGKFMGEVIVTSTMTVDLVDMSVVTVKAYFEQMKLNGNLGDCVQDEDKGDLWHCSWSAMEIKPESSVSVMLVAEDAAGNLVEKTILKSFVKDTSAPTIDYFGTEHTYNDKNYMSAKSSDERIILRVKEQGAGMNESGVRLNLKAFGKGISVAPNECVVKEGIFECYWSVSSGSSSSEIKHVGLSKFQDNVGNEGKMPEIEVIVDNDPPKVMKIEVYGKSEIGDKDYFQSNDQLKIKLTVAEVSGLIVVVDMNKLVMDVETKYPITDYTRSEGVGWAVFTEKDCVRDEDAKTWTCVFETAPLMSGPDTTGFTIKVKDTAGNSAINWQSQPKHVKSVVKVAGEYTIDLLGLSTEGSPDYWSAKSKPVGGDSAFVDLDTTQLTNARIPFTVQLSSKTTKVKVLKVEMNGCEGESQSLAFSNTSSKETKPTISRALLYGGKFSAAVNNPVPTVVLEFAPFDGHKLFDVGAIAKDSDVKKVMNYTCQLKIYSQVGNNAIQYAELQEVIIKVPFAFSKLGADDENLDAKIKEAKDDANNLWWKTIGTLNKVLHYVDYGVQAVAIVTTAIGLVDVIKGNSDVLKSYPVTEGARISGCFGLNGLQASMDTGIQIVDQFIQVLSCRPTPDKLGWYGRWQQTVLSLYNLELLKSPDSPLSGKQMSLRPARNVKDNLYLSVAAICLPGIIKNLDKYRQIKCRKVYCLQNEVKAGLATVEQCDRLENLLTCKYFFGELWYILPGSQFFDKGIRAIWDALKDPIAAAHTLTIGVCGVSCLISGTASGTCAKIKYFWAWVDELESIIGFIVTIKDDISSGGLQYCDSVL